jgi:hypothetical protein
VTSCVIGVRFAPLLDGSRPATLTVRDAGGAVLQTVTLSGTGGPGTVLPPTFTDDPLLAGSTHVKAVHIAELHQAINTLRAGHALPAVAWSDAPVTVTATVVRAVHLTEARTVLGEAYAAAHRTLPTYTRTVVTARTSDIMALDVAELRAAVRAIW